MSGTPKWLEIGNVLNVELLRAADAALNPTRRLNFALDLAAIPYLALRHLVRCFKASDIANREGAHSAAICLVRQGVEALTLIDIGLQPIQYASGLLSDWNDGKRTHGELRARLEKDVWPRYGTGLWDEPWSEFFGNLARAIQPYAHYTPQVMGWQFAYAQPFAEKEPSPHWTLLDQYDALKASRITLLHGLTIWTLGRLLGSNVPIPVPLPKIVELGTALGDSKLLFRKSDWSLNFMPDMIFQEGYDWRDE